MSYTNKHIIKNYSLLFEGLHSLTKIELIESLTKSLKREKNIQKDDFFKSFGAFGSEKPAEEIVKEIKSSRKLEPKKLNSNAVFIRYQYLCFLFKREIKFR